MIRFGKIFLLALCALLGLAACSSTMTVDSTPTIVAPNIPTLPVGQAAFLISYADW